MNTACAGVIVGAWKSRDLFETINLQECATTEILTVRDVFFSFFRPSDRHIISLLLNEWISVRHSKNCAHNFNEISIKLRNLIGKALGFTHTQSLPTTSAGGKAHLPQPHYAINLPRATSEQLCVICGRRKICHTSSELIEHTTADFAIRGCTTALKRALGMRRAFAGRREILRGAQGTAVRLARIVGTDA